MLNKTEQDKNLDFEISFFEGLIKDEPNFIDALVPLAECYTKKGLYENGLEIDLRLSSLRPHDPLMCYNLACSYSLTNNTDLALTTLEKSLQLGYRGFNWLKEDPDLENIRQSKRYQEIVEKFTAN